jgi:hypothetical protein
MALDTSLDMACDIARDVAQDIAAESVWGRSDGVAGSGEPEGSAAFGRPEVPFGPCHVPGASDLDDASDDVGGSHEPEGSDSDSTTPDSASPGSESPGSSNRLPADDLDGVVWRQAGATIFVPRGAPDPRLFRPRLDEDAIERLFVAKREARERGIDGLVREAERTKPAGAPERDRFVARIRWDTEFAPKTTNRRQLAEIGVDVPTREQLPASEVETHRELWRVIYGLARLGIFFTETDGIGDRAMLEMLAARVLEDSVSDIPPNGDMSEFIALCPPAEEESDESASPPPDGLRGPFETDEDDDGSWDAWDAMDPGDAPGAEDPERPKEDRCGLARDPLLGPEGDPDLPEVPRTIPPELRRDHLLPQPWRV